MRVFSALIAVGSLLGAVVFAPLVIGALLSLILVGAFLLALVGVLSSLEDQTVRQHDPAMDPKGWRNGSGPGHPRNGTCSLA